MVSLGCQGAVEPHRTRSFERPQLNSGTVIHIDRLNINLSKPPPSLMTEQLSPITKKRMADPAVAVGNAQWHTTGHTDWGCPTLACTVRSNCQKI
jgi:hypothetical protein